MESHNSAAVTILLSTLLLIIFLIKRNKNNHRQLLPPGRTGWPVIGDSYSWYNSVLGPHPPEFVQQQVSRFGSSVFSCRLFGGWAVVSADPGFNRFVLQSEGRVFKSSYPKSFRDLVGKNGVVTAQGDQQRKLHGIASGMMKVERFKLEDIQRVMGRTLVNCCCSVPDRVVSLQDVCRKVAINLMVNQLLGVSPENEVDQMAELFSDFVDGCLSVPINLPGFAYHTAMKAREKITSKINKVVDKTRAAEVTLVGKEETCGASNNGLLGRLLKEGSIEDEAISDFIINLLFAGNETTAKTMVFAVYFLTHCPQAMQQLLDEQDSLRRNDQMLTWDDYKAMPFTQCVIDETLRLGGIAIWLFREAIEDVSYQDYVIPKGCLVVPFLSAVHLDEKLYDGARNFNPWRWMEPQNQDKRNWRSSPYFTPFGAGARFCPGAELARLQIALFLHYFVTTYRWMQVKEDRMSFFPSARLVNGFQIRLRRRHEEESKPDCQCK
ncbi:Abietadienol/abietadienal oxidase [Linum perenne]